jgi:hypothetical protein
MAVCCARDRGYAGHSAFWGITPAQRGATVAERFSGDRWRVMTKSGWLE